MITSRAVIAALCICIAALVFVLLQRDLEAAAKVDCLDLDTRERIRKLSLDGYDQALVDHTARLFDIWIKDGDPEPKRASVGTQNGISAYVRARKQALEWNPPPCPSEK